MAREETDIAAAFDERLPSSIADDLARAARYNDEGGALFYHASAGATRRAAFRG